MADKAKKKKPTNVLDIGTNLTIENITSLYAQFTSQTENQKNIMVVSDKIEIIDLSGIQFLIHIRALTKKKDIKLNLKCNPIDSVSDLAEKSGFFNLFEN